MQRPIALSAVTLILSLLVLPAFANSNGNSGLRAYDRIGFGGYTGKQVIIDNNSTGNRQHNNDRPSQLNPVLADNGDVRASKAIDTDVYNADNKKLGTLDDILIGKNGVWAVISLNPKKIAVRFNRLEFGDAVKEEHNKVVLPNETEASLNAMPAFHYDVTTYPKVTK